MGLEQKLDAGRFAILAEMEPPKGVDVSGMVAGALKVKGLVDAFVVPEMSNAVMRMSSLGGAVVLQRNGLETVMQLNCRDRNRLALQADLLAGSACGVANVMVVPGEDPSFGDHHQARSVHDIDPLELLGAIDTLQGGRDLAGVELSGTPSFLVGSTVMAGAPGRSAELLADEVKKQCDAGARFFVTPPLFAPEVIEPFLKRIDRQQASIIPTVLLLKSLGMARYMARNLEHVHIPEAVIQRLMKAPDKVRECVAIAAETVQAVRAMGLGGAMLATLGWEHKLPEILEAARG